MDVRCSTCGERATVRCAGCQVPYCSRACQHVEHNGGLCSKSNRGFGTPTHSSGKIKQRLGDQPEPKIKLKLGEEPNLKVIEVPEEIVTMSTVSCFEREGWRRRGRRGDTRGR